MKITWMLLVATPAAIAAGWWARGSLEPEVETPASSYGDASTLNSNSANEAELAQILSQVEADDGMGNARDGLPQGFAARQAVVDSIGADPSMENITQALQIIMAMRPRDLRAALEQTENRHARRLLMERWVEIDPEGVNAYLLASGEDKFGLTSKLMSQWANTDIDRALAATKRLPESLKSRAYSTLIQELGKSDPYRALALIQSGEMGDQVNWRYRSLMSIWTREDPTAARAAIASIPPGYDQDQAWSGYFGAMGDIDPQLAFTEAQKFSDYGDRKRMLERVYSSWLRKDMDAAFTALGEIPSATLRSQIISQQYWRLPLDDPDKLMAYINEYTDGNRQENIVSNFVGRLADSDPLWAAAVVDQLPFGNSYRNSVNSLVNEWAKNDPIAAMTWLDTLPPGDEKSYGQANALKYYAKNSPEDALRYYLTIDPANKDFNQLSRLSEGMMHYNPELATQLVAQVNQDDVRTKLQTEMVKDWSKNDPQAALDYLQQLGQEVSGNTASEIGRNWAGKNPAEAAAWAQSLEGDAQVNAIRSVSDQWLRHDSYVASEWISTLPESPARDAAIGNIVNKTMNKDPAAALDWATGVSDERQRYNLVQNTLRNWKNQDDAAAQAALRKSDLPVDTINKLLEENWK